MALFDKAVRCGACKAEMKEEARFCPQCGKPASFILRRCMKEGCDGIAKHDDEFCPRCGGRLPKVESEVRFDIVWTPAPGDLARRFKVDTEKQVVEGSVTVRYDQQALLLGDGAILKTLDPGAHPIETTLRDHQVGAQGARRFEVLFLDGAEVLLNYGFEGIPAKDGVPCTLGLRFVVEVREPERLLAAVMKGAALITAEGIRLRMASEVRNAVEEAASKWPADEIVGSRAKKDELARQVMEHLRQTFMGLGFELIRVETLHAKVPALDQVRQKRAARGVMKVEKDEAVARVEQDVDYHRRKAAAWDELRKSVHEARKEKYRDTTSLIDFIRTLKRQIKEKELISDAELEELTAGLDYKKEDRETARAFILKKIQQEQDYELERLAAKRKVQDLETRIQEARLRAEAEGVEVRARIDLVDYEHGSGTGQRRREQDLELDGEERRIALEEKRREQDEHGRDRASERELARLRAKTEAYERMKAVKADAAANRMRAAVDLSPEQIAAVFAEEQPRLADVLREAFSARNANEKAEMERRHGKELREIFEAAQTKDSATVELLVRKLSDSMGHAVRERAEAGDREAATTIETVRVMRGDDAPERKRCRVCHCEWTSDTIKCPSCGESAD